MLIALSLRAVFGLFAWLAAAKHCTPARWPVWVCLGWICLCGPAVWLLMVWFMVVVCEWRER